MPVKAELAAAPDLVELSGQEQVEALPHEINCAELEALPRVAVVCDYREEQWPSMDLVAEMLLVHLRQDHSERVAAAGLCPPMRRRFTHLRSNSRRLFNADRLMNRFWDYSRWLKLKQDEFDLFHVMDHSYAQLLHKLPPERTIVTCHDLDTFRCLTDPSREPRSKLYRAMTQRILDGFCKAARVTCDSVATRDELLAHNWFPPERVHVIHNGVSPAYSTQFDEKADTDALRLLGALPEDAIMMLHVGSTIPRKRIDILLRIFAALHKRFPKLRLVRVGGALTEAQRRLASQLELEHLILELPFLEKSVLAAVYRKATVLLQPSDAEGFGLPIVEALACGTPVVASDLPVLHEVGGEATTYCPVADVSVWAEAVAMLLHERQEEPGQWDKRRALGLAQAAKFSWAEYARKMVALYQELMSEA